MRRKSTAITLTMLAGTAIALGGCLEDKPKTMTSEADCVSQIGDAEACKAASEQARKEHEQNAPKFNNLAECEAQFGPGKCNTVTRSGGGSSFAPMFMGFMLGNMMSSGNRVYTTTPYYGRSWTKSKVAAAKPVAAPYGSPAIVRGGFGRSAYAGG